MSEFIELTERDGNRVLINTERIIKVKPDDSGCYLSFDSRTISGFHVEESFATIKRLLQQ